MSLADYLLILLHIVPWALGMGASFYFSFIAIPMANRYLEGDKRLEFLRRNVRYYSPFFLLMMSVVVVSGAFRLTDYKHAFGRGYFEAVATPLIAKLAFFLVVYVLAAYQSFGLGLRITGVGEKAMGEKVELDIIELTIQKMRTIAIINLLFMTVAALIGLKLSRISYPFN